MNRHSGYIRSLIFLAVAAVIVVQSGKTMETAHIIGISALVLLAAWNTILNFLINKEIDRVEKGNADSPGLKR